MRQCVESFCYEKISAMMRFYSSRSGATYVVVIEIKEIKNLSRAHFHSKAYISSSIRLTLRLV